jgi:hypothetical protein
MCFWLSYRCIQDVVEAADVAKVHHTHEPDTFLLGKAAWRIISSTHGDVLESVLLPRRLGSSANSLASEDTGRLPNLLYGTFRPIRSKVRM